MQSPRENSVSRRDFLKNTGRVAAATALAAAMVPHVHAAENNTIQLALIGCGGRGSGAAGNAISVKNGPVKLVAMADVFENRLAHSYKQLKKQYADAVQVPEERRFIGFDAYQKAMDCLKPGDIAIFATPPAFRWVNFTYAIQKGLNVFMEKPVTVDGPTSHKMFALAEEAKAKNLKVAVGLMSRHSRAMQELAQRIDGGEIGDLILLRGYRMIGPLGSFRSPPKPDGISELLYQVQRFHSFMWASGGAFSEFNIHVVDHCGWMKNAWPVQAQALGGRNYRGGDIDQNFDTYSVEYTFADDTKFLMDARYIKGCKEIYNSFAHGTKGTAIVSSHGDCGLPSATFQGLGAPSPANRIWESKVAADEQNPYQNEWNELIDAVRNDKPYNEAKRGVEASLVCAMGRMAAHTGQIVTFDQILNAKQEFAPDVDKLTMDSPPPLRAGADGLYPVPKPGILVDREY